MLRKMLFAASLLATVVCPAAAQMPVVDAHHDAMQKVILADWIKRVEAELGTQLGTSRLRGSASGIVTVKFNCSENGRTDKVAIQKSSGSHDLDRAAVRAVERIAVMHPLASGMKPTQVYYAKILFANYGDYRIDRQMAALHSGAHDSNAWFDKQLVQ